MAWNRIADSEDGIHSRNDYFMQIIKKFRISQYFTSQLLSSVVRIEEKAETANLLDDANLELSHKMVKWLP